jgi:adenylate kinase
MYNIVLFGPPGAGKGTQSEKIIEKFNLTHISTGDLFRKHLGEGTDLGKLAQKYMDEGNLVPDELVIKMVERKLNDQNQSDGFIFDGFPRTVNQAEALDQLLEKSGYEISGMILLDVDEQELINRIILRGKTSGRTDDQDIEKVNNRIKVYNEETLPVATYYKSQGKLNTIVGKGSIEDIFSNISKVIEELAH